MSQQQPITPASDQYSENRRNIGALLRAQQQRGFRWLRFQSALEFDFHRYYRDSGRPFRLIMLSLALALVAAAPVYEWTILGASVVYSRGPWLGLFSVEVLVIAVALFVTARRSLQAYADSVLSVAALLLAGSLLLERAIGALYGFEVPLELTAIIIVAVFFIARLRFRTFVPVALALTALMAVNELWFVRIEPDDGYRLLTMFMLIGVAFVGGYAQEYMVRGSWLDNALLAHVSEQDGLTGLLNHRAAHQMMQRSLRQAGREAVPFGLALADIDYFKAYNDHYGHKAGDECLVRVAELLQQAVRRPLDCAGRLGGEEFVVAWYGASPEEMERMAERMRRLLADERIEHARSENAEQVTMSIGLITLTPDRTAQVDRLIEVADRLMYRAKEAGRNCLVVEHGVSL